VTHVHWRYEVRATDQAAVRKLVAATGFFSPDEEDVAVELVEETLAKGSDASGYEFVLADDSENPGQILGYACFGPIPATVSSYDLYWIAVKPGLQRAGLGRKLIRESERRAIARGATRMFVDTSGREQYTPTRAFYERMGYREEGRLRDFYAPGDDKVIYARDLAA
jgi:ribosomal protein S18 acetylase RimI-like enzyme